MSNLEHTIINHSNDDNIYQHYKGKLYRMDGIFTHTETKEKLVAYTDMGNIYKRWTTPFSRFIGTVEYNGQTVPRFTRAEEKENV